MRSALSPNTTRTPALSWSSGLGPARAAAAAGLARTPSWSTTAESTNVAASMPRADRAPMNATTRPPATAPTTIIRRNVDWSTAAASA